MFIVIFIGMIMRLVWVEDMEWKDDEKIMYNLAHEVANKGRLPAVGMMSGGGIVNPGLSVGVFAFIAFFTDGPLAMVRAVELINILAIVLFILFIYIKVPVIERDIWLWGIALAAVSPLAVLFSRKIWAQDLLPVFCLLLIFGNAYRKQRWGAFLWGFGCAIIGQVHMSGFFLAAGITIFTLLHDSYHKKPIRGMFFIFGVLAGVAWLIPWVIYIINNGQHSYLLLKNILAFSFYRYWMLDIHGLHLIYSLGDNFWDFLKEPVIYGTETNIVAMLHVFLCVVGLFTVLLVLQYIWKQAVIFKTKKIASLIFEDSSLARFYLFGILIGLGILMTISGTEIYPHYLICTFPFSYIFLVKVHFQRKSLLRLVIIAQMVITFCFLLYIHQHGGALRGDYKRTYKNQLQNNISN